MAIKLIKLDYLMAIMTMLLFTSCAKPLLTISNNTDRLKLSTPILSKINGDYEIMTIDTMRTTLSMSFIPKDKFHFESLPGKDDKISIKIIGNNIIKMALVADGKVIRQRKIKFNVTDNHIEYKRNYISPFWLLINGYANTRVRIGLLANGNLTMDISYVTTGFLGVIPFTADGGADYNLIYARKNSSH